MSTDRMSKDRKDLDVTCTVPCLRGSGETTPCGCRMYEFKGVRSCSRGHQETENERLDRLESERYAWEQTAPPLLRNI